MREVFPVMFLFSVAASFMVSCSDVSPTVAPEDIAVEAALAAPGTGNDSDGDGIKDNRDNCPNHANPAQDDTDQDGCGNICDGDFDQDWIAGYSDFGQMTAAVGTFSPVHNLSEPVDDEVSVEDVLVHFAPLFGKSVCGR